MLIRSSTSPIAPAPIPRAPFTAAAQQHMNQPPAIRGLRASEAVPASYNADSHTVELMLSSGSRVKRWGYFEELLIDAKAIDLSRIASGAVKVLNSHNAWDVAAILGTLISARVEAGQLIGTMKFADTAAATEAERMVSRGDLTSVSIGYEVRLWRASEVITDPNTQSEITVWRADEWALLEVSFVSIPADPAAGVRSAVFHSGKPLSADTGGAMKEEDMLTRADPGAPASAVPPAAGLTRFTPDEAVNFVALARSFGVEARARELVAMNSRGVVGTQACSDAILAAAAERQDANVGHIIGSGNLSITGDPQEAVRRGITEALVSRLSGSAPATEAGRQFRGMSMIDMIRYQMRARGEHGADFLAPVDVASRMHTTSDFPMLLTQAGERVLLDIFAAAPNAIKTVARKTTIDDFRTKHSIKLGALPELPLVLESGEVKHLSTSESYENYALGTHAGKFALTRQAIINDDLGAFADFMMRMAQAAVETEAAQMVALLAKNNWRGPTLTDTKALFHSDHGNIATTGTAISVPALSAARLAMRTQRNLDGKTLAPVVPKTLLVGAVKESEGESVLAALNAAKVEDVNPFSGKLALAVEPRITGNGWYVFGDPVYAPVIEYAYLTGSEGPKVEMKEGWDVLGAEFRVILDFGCGIVDHRGAYRNDGDAGE